MENGMAEWVMLYTSTVVGSKLKVGGLGGGGEPKESVSKGPRHVCIQCM